MEEKNPNNPRHDLDSSGTDKISAGRRGVLVVEQEEMRRKESTKEMEESFGDGKDGSRGSKKGGRNGLDIDEGAGFKNGPRIVAVAINGREHLEGIPMTSRIAQNVTTPRGHGRRDGETKQVNLPSLLSGNRRHNNTCPGAWVECKRAPVYCKVYSEYYPLYSAQCAV